MKTLKIQPDYDLLRPVFPQMKQWRDELEAWQEQQNAFALADRILFPEDYETPTINTG